MAKNSGSKPSVRSAVDTSPTLDPLSGLLSPADVLASVTEVQQMWERNKEALTRAPQLDLRRYHPRKYDRPAPALIRAANRDVVGETLRDIRAALPHKVAICLRRKIRREVLFGLGLHVRVGRGGGSKPRHRNQYTKVKC